MGNLFSFGGYYNLKGHKQIAAVCFLPNGDLVSAGDRTLRLWHSTNGKLLKTWQLYGDVETCCCSPDGTCIACGVVDGLVFVFNVSTKQQIAGWQAHQECGQGPLLQFLADSTSLLSAAVFTCKIWCARTSQLINIWETTLMTSLHMTADGRQLAVGSHLGIVTIHLLPWGYTNFQIHAHQGEVWSVKFSPDQSLLATASSKEVGWVKLWETDGWDLVHTLRGHSDVVLDCSFAPNGLGLITCGFDRTVRVWSRSKHRADDDGGTWNCDNILAGHSDAILACAYSPTNAGIVASGANDGGLRAWRLTDAPRVETNRNLLA